MFALMLTVITFAISLGYVQGTMDPEAANNTWSTLSLFSDELDVSEKVGLFVGAFSAITIEIIRQMEVKHRQPYEETTGTFADSNNLNFESDSEEGELSGGDFFGNRNSPRGSFFKRGFMDDEENESLVRFS